MDVANPGLMRPRLIPHLTRPIFINSSDQLLHTALLLLNEHQRFIAEQLILGTKDLEGLAEEICGAPPGSAKNSQACQAIRRYLEGAGYAKVASLNLPDEADVIIVDAGFGGVFVHAVDLWELLHRRLGVRALLIAPREPPYGYDQELADWLITPRSWAYEPQAYSRLIGFVGITRAVVSLVPARLLLFTHRFPSTFLFDLIPSRRTVIHADGYFEQLLQLGTHLQPDGPCKPTVEVLQELYYGEPFGTHIATSLAHVLAVSWSFRKATENWFWCEPQRRIAEKYFPELSGAFRVVLPLIDIDRFQPGPTSLPTRDILYTTTSDRGTIQSKGLRELVEAMKRLPESVTLRMVVGSRDVVPSEVDALGDRVEVLVRQAKERMPEIYRSCRMNCRVSRRESSPVSILESMSCGLPVVVSPIIAENISAIQDGRTGFVVDPDQVETLVQRLKTLAVDDDLRRSMGEAARLGVRQYSYDANIQRIVRLIQAPQPRHAQDPKAPEVAVL